MTVVCLLLGWQTAFALSKSEETLFAMDTYITLTVYGKKGDKALEAAKQIISENEQKWSVSLENSEIYALNANSSAVVSESTLKIINAALEMSEFTLGAFDPTVYPLVDVWGFTSKNYTVPSEDELETLLARVGTENVQTDGTLVTLTNGACLDLGGIAKGYTGDMIIDCLKEYGVKYALINLGGNVQTLGAKPDGTKWNIGIRSPLSEELMGAVRVANKCVITSGAYERYFETEDGVRYGHIISPFTGKPADTGILSVTVVTDSGKVGDALSTALFVMGKDEAISFWRANGGFEMLILDSEGVLYITEGIYSAFTQIENETVKSICKVSTEK